VPRKLGFILNDENAHGIWLGGGKKITP